MAIEWKKAGVGEYWYTNLGDPGGMKVTIRLFSPSEYIGSTTSIWRLYGDSGDLHVSKVTASSLEDAQELARFAAYLWLKGWLKRVEESFSK